MQDFPTTRALLAYWDMPWSGKRLQWATWAIWAAQVRTGVAIIEGA